MGSTFAGLHLRTTDSPAAAAAVTAALGAEGLVPATEPADRTVALVPAGRWLAVLDDTAEGGDDTAEGGDDTADDGDDTALDALGAALSRQLAAPAVGALVHDSDALRLCLYEGGKRRDRFDSAPDFMGTRKTRPASHVEAWRHLAVEPAALPEAFARGGLFAEQALDPLARALGMDPARVAVGYRYQAEAGWPPGTVLLHFRDPRAAAPAPAGGAPQLAVTAPPVAPPFAVGAEVHLGLGLRSTGSALHGLRVEVEGGEGVVAWRAVRSSLLPPARGSLGEVPLAEGAATLAVDVPAGMPLDPQAIARNPRKAIALLTQGSFHVAPVGTAVAPGTAALTLRLRDSGGRLLLEVPAQVQVRSNEGRPLRADGSMPPQLLDALDDESWLTALVICTLDRRAAVERLAPIIAALAPFAPSEGPVTRTIFPAGGGGLLGALRLAGPKLWTGKAAGFFSGKAWAKTLEAARDAAQVDLRFGEAEDGPDTSTWRLTLGGGLVTVGDSATALAVGLHHAPPQAEAALVAAIDEVVRAGDIAQAFASRRGPPPSPELTAYEACCGVHGQCTLQRAWVSRWLRAVPVGTLWLGPELLAHLPADASARLEIPERGPAERLLAELLPSALDWQQGVRASYGR